MRVGKGRLKPRLALQERARRWIEASWSGRSMQGARILLARYRHAGARWLARNLDSRVHAAVTHRHDPGNERKRAQGQHPGEDAAPELLAVGHGRTDSRISGRLRAIVGPVERSRARGFTLPEVMNFVALAAVLSALGMYGLAKYVRHAKTAEAVGSVTAIAEAAASYYDTSDGNQPVGTTADAAHAMRHFPPSSKPSVPPELESVSARRYQSSIADWTASPWRELRFSIPQPQYYVYSFESQGSGASAKAIVTAHGDLDGDGITSTYRLVVAPDATFKAKVSDVMEKLEPEE